jgi:hypothetical protein
MREPYSEGLASHADPESCVGRRKGAGEVLTGAHAGQVLNREMNDVQGADAVGGSGRQHLTRRNGEPRRDPAWSQTLCMYGNTLRENREVLRFSWAGWRSGARREAASVIRR